MVEITPLQITFSHHFLALVLIIYNTSYTAALQREGTRGVWDWRESSWKGIKGSAKVLPPLPPHASCSPTARLLLEHPVL